MAESIVVSGNNKKEKYESLIPQLTGLIEGESDVIANLSNIVAALKFSMDYFWVGIYFVKSVPSLQSPTTSIRDSKQLILGPFQGPVACTRIAFGKGVCGKCWELKQTLVVDDVEKFPGHIACSSLSKSEIVIPVFDDKEEVTIVIDIDSERYSDFDVTDKFYLEKIAKLIEERVLIHK